MPIRIDRSQQEELLGFIDRIQKPPTSTPLFPSEGTEQIETLRDAILRGALTEGEFEKLRRILEPMRGGAEQLAALVVRFAPRSEESSKEIIIDGQKITQEDVDRLLAVVLQVYKKPNESDKSAEGIEFFKKHLADLIQAGLFRLEHYEKVRTFLNYKDPARWVKACLFLGETLPPLITAGFFSQKDYEAIVAGLGHKYYEKLSALDFFEKQIPALGRLNLFRHSDYNLLTEKLEDGDPSIRQRALNVFNAHLESFVSSGWFQKEHYDFIARNLPGYKNDFLRETTVTFFLKYLPVLLEKGFFTHGDLKAMIGNLAETRHPPIREKALGFFKGYLPTLIKANIFGPEDCIWIIEKVLFHFEPSVREGGEKFFEANLDTLLETKAFSSEAYELAAEALPNRKDAELGNRGVDFFRGHLLQLVEHGLLRGREIGNLAYVDFDFFVENFYALKNAGLINEETLKGFLEYAPRVRSPAKAILMRLAQSEELLLSPSRWKALKQLLPSPQVERVTGLTITTAIEANQARLNAEEIFGLLYKANDPATPEEIASLVSTLNELGKSGLQRLGWNFTPEPNKGLLYTMPSWMRLDLEKTAEFFGVTDHPIYQATSAKIAGPQGDSILLDWYLTGLGIVWGKYREAPEEELKAKRKLFLNFLEQNLKRNPPTLCRLITKRGQEIIEELFVESLESGISPPEKEALEKLREGPVWNRLKKSPLYRLFIKASGFMEAEGLASLRRLIFGLRLEEGRLVYPRYEELKGVVGEQFLEGWKKEYAVELKDLSSLDEESGKKALKTQVLEQVKTHLDIKEGSQEEKIPENIRHLPTQIRQWMESFEASEAWDGEFAHQAQRLGAIFEAHYREIRAYFGDTFANIRTDLRNFTIGIEKGVKVARKSERFIISGDVEKIARSGSEPVHTCQTLEYSWVNEKGEPIHRILHGQFKVANWEIDNVVMARRLLEVTIDETGKEHLLVERLYSVGGFGRVKEFRSEILKYAKGLGIDESSVHFSDEDSFETAPKALKTGDRIYRDTFEEGDVRRQPNARRHPRRRPASITSEERGFVVIPISHQLDKGAELFLSTVGRGVARAGIGGVPFGVGEYVSNILLGHENPTFQEFAKNFAALTAGGGTGRVLVDGVTKNGFAKRSIPLFMALALADYVKQGKIDWEHLPQGIANIMIASGITHGLGTVLTKASLVKKIAVVLRLIKIGSIAGAPETMGVTLLGACLASIVEFTILKVLGDIEQKVVLYLEEDKLRQAYAEAIQKNNDLMSKYRMARYMRGVDSLPQELLKAQQELFSAQMRYEGFMLGKLELLKMELDKKMKAIDEEEIDALTISLNERWSRQQEKEYNDKERQGLREEYAGKIRVVKRSDDQTPPTAIPLENIYAGEIKETLAINLENLLVQQEEYNSRLNAFWSDALEETAAELEVAMNQ
ncbi:MAG: hypothetical protein A3F82_08125 [Deltaproteobacteria bacterium RIFCSPLOWO2_12_FULL_44_12]|nr:MAG: hypothetical protein A2712_07145 [Deltaproteobacteria bacterium RIFCSPHIGHO2_01_FULL_43_49]OGQ15722.1 MAG: hypothetical protein A3D22_05935 [Deltaproteobacteria bacterium RIFCSPHIGHO2_02_FULL_44_53]OGQ28691.1 MAG: hypothetical protein A3D98_00670 [Deltaproteobacteria bacterium RIFCSPHIGHO2_12_FULL_44_21]OGQ32014.1 MAG: hypothetical protein A2979_02880 [Deltaproteobacteria bacterium RIFCSPLOWO2_01_FULL_45_74]OGQ43627.1 MAG: hypothetical protein A3I70_03395 [Deltaproteobacteria bacterium 